MARDVGMVMWLSAYLQKRLFALFPVMSNRRRVLEHGGKFWFTADNVEGKGHDFGPPSGTLGPFDGENGRIFLKSHFF